MSWDSLDKDIGSIPLDCRGSNPHMLIWLTLVGKAGWSPKPTVGRDRHLGGLLKKGEYSMTTVFNIIVMVIVLGMAVFIIIDQYLKSKRVKEICKEMREDMAELKSGAYVEVKEIADRVKVLRFHYPNEKDNV